MNNLRYWLAANFIGLSTYNLLKVVDIIGDIKDLFSLTLQDYKAIGFSERQINVLLKPNWSEIDRELNWLASSPLHSIVTYQSALYPKQLKQIPDPPLLLYIKGDIENLNQPQIAMVGSRNPSKEGLEVAFEFASELSSELVITSGLARGIDTASHRGALAAEGKTIAICGTGLSQVYPAQNRQLAEKIIAKQGTLISEFPLSSPPRAIHFPMRNRIISGLSLGVLVIEAAIKSGSLVTARHALTQGREVFAIPGQIKSPFATGCHLLIKQGATLVDNIDDVFSALYIKKRTYQMQIVKNKSASTLDLSAEEHHILSLITSDWIAFDQVLLLSRLTIGELSSMLLSLELRNFIQSVAGGYKRIVTE